MRDKVKRFISILMTALMLVNLMPVGALADGITSGGYQQQVAAAHPAITDKIYVYAKIEGVKPGDVQTNASGWYTIGYIDNVNMTSPWVGGSNPYYNKGKACGYTTPADAVSLITGGNFHHRYNLNIPVENTQAWLYRNDCGFKACDGADNYVGNGIATWHLNIFVKIEAIQPAHELIFKDRTTGEEIKDRVNVKGNKGTTRTYYAGDEYVPESITKDGKEYQISAYNPNLRKAHGFDYVTTEIEIFYDRVSDLNYTVNHYWVGSNKPFKTDSGKANKGEVITAKDKILTDSGYTFKSASADSITISSDENANVLNLYYYKNVTLTAKSDTKTYNGEEQSVSGYDCSVDGLTFEEITAGATGTDVGEYTAKFAKDPVGTLDNTKKYIVTKANPGKLTITAATDKVTVTIEGNKVTAKYDGTEKTASGYSVVASNPLYTTNDFTFSGNAEVKGTDAKTYPMGLDKSQFTNTSKNFTNVEFVVTDGGLTISKRNVTLTSASDEKVYDGNALTNDTVTVGGEGFVGKEGATYKVTGTQTNVGESKNTFTYELKDGTKAGNYEITPIEGTLKVTQVTDTVTVKIKENSGTAKYDGTEKTVTGYTVESISNKLYTKDDFKFTGKAEVKGTDAGTYDMELKASDFQNTNTSFAKVTFVIEDGTLTISKRNVTLTSADDEKVYDGNALTNDTVTVGGEGFVGKEGATYKVTGTQTNVGKSKNAFTYTLNKGTDAKNYNIELAPGTLEVTAATDEVVVTITENSGTEKYDGTEKTVKGYTVKSISNSLYTKDDFEFNGKAEVKGTNAGTYNMELKPADFENKNNNFSKVTFVIEDGKLEITKRNVKLTSADDKKVYDGKPLTNDEVTVSGDGFAEGEVTEIKATGSQTLVGESENTITYTKDEKFKDDNYIITTVLGTLTVTDVDKEGKLVDPSLVVTKKHGTEIDTDTAQSLYNLGDEVTFTVSVTNIYDEQKEVTLEEQPGVTFVDPQGVAIGTKATKTLEPGEKWEIQATYTITSADILAGGFTNTVTAIFGDKSWTAKDTVTTAELDTTLNVTKISDVPDGQKAALGQKITYTITVENAGNVPYTNVKVEDPLTGLVKIIETLPVGETETFITEYVVTEADVLKGSVLNTATATGDPIKDPKKGEEQVPDGGDEVETPTFAPITLKPKDVTATYNGAAITGKDVEITSGKLLEGHKLSAAVIGSGVNAGSYELTIDKEKIKIVDENNNDVSKMYVRTVLPGTLTIAKRSVLITSQSATKTYDGSALTRPAVTITGDGFVPGELAKAEATGSITKVGSTPNTIQYTTTGAFNAANYSIALSVGTLTVTEKPQPEPRRTFNLTINYVYQNGKRAAASYNRGGLKNGETFDITSPVIAGYTASETVVSGTIYNRDIKVTVIYTADGVNLDDYGVPLGLGNITMNVGDCFE